MVNTISINTKFNLTYILPIAVLVAVISSIEILVLNISVVLFSYLFIIYKEKFLLFFVVITFIIVTYKISTSLRLAVQVINFAILFILFFKNYGLNYKNYPKVPASVIYYLIALLTIMLISSFNSSYLILGIEKFATVFLFLILMYLIFTLIKDKTEVNILLFSLVACSVISLVILLLEMYKYQFDLLQLYQQIFTSDAYLGKNNLAVLFSIVILFLSCYLLSGFFKSKKFFYLLILLLSFGLVVTNSRASILCLLISLGVILFIINKKILLKGIISVVVLAAILLLTPLFDEILLLLRLDNIGTGRDFITEAVWQVIKNNIILGTGPAASRFELYSDLPFMLNTPAEWMIAKVYNLGDIGQTHNFYLFFFSDMGIPGLFLSLALPIIYFSMCKKIYNATKIEQNLDYYILVGLIGSGAFIFSRGLFEQMNIISYGQIYYDLPFWLLVSILVYYFNKYVKA